MTNLIIADVSNVCCAQRETAAETRHKETQTARYERVLNHCQLYCCIAIHYAYHDYVALPPSLVLCGDQYKVVICIEVAIRYYFIILSSGNA